MLVLILQVARKWVSFSNEWIYIFSKKKKEDKKKNELDFVSLEVELNDQLFYPFRLILISKNFFLYDTFQCTQE